MGFPFPVTLRRKHDQVRLRQYGHAHRRGERVEHLAATDSAQIDQIAAAALKERLPPCLADRGEDEIASCLNVECRNDELAKSGLAKILKQEFRIPSAQIGRRRLF